MSSRTLFATVWMAVAVFLCLVLYRPITTSPTTAATRPQPSPLQSATGTASPTGTRTPASPAPSPAPRTRSIRPAVDVTRLIRPERDYLGIAMDEAHKDPRQIDSFARRVGIRPNLITIYQGFGDDFAAESVEHIYRVGALPLVRWEPFAAPLADIAAGRHDRYVRSYARAVRRLNVPVAMTFAHEMNGFWYPWDAHHVTSSDYIAAWRRIHDIFRAEGATNVIWCWAPNVISGGPGVELIDWYPGDAHVDWIGIDGYFVAGGPNSYETLFGPTIREVNAFTDRPFLIVETGVEAGWLQRHRVLKSLLRGVAADDRMIGFVYFNQSGSRQWQLTGDPTALAILAEEAKRLRYGFTVR